MNNNTFGQLLMYDKENVKTVFFYYLNMCVCVCHVINVSCIKACGLEFVFNCRMKSRHEKRHVIVCYFLFFFVFLEPMCMTFFSFSFMLIFL